MKTLSLLFLLITLPVLGQVSFSGAKLSGFSVGPPPPASSGDYTNNLSNWWKMSENTGTLTLDSITGSNATLAASGRWLNTEKGVSIWFDGSADDITMGTNTTAGPLTVAMWVNPTNTAAYMGLIRDTASGGSAGYYLRASNHLCRFNVSAATPMIHEWDVPLTVSNWVQFVVTWDGTVTDYTKSLLYTNGVLCTSTLAGSSQNGSGSNSKYTGVSRLIGNANGASRFSGYMKGVRVYSEALSALNVAIISTNWP